MYTKQTDYTIVRNRISNTNHYSHNKFNDFLWKRTTLLNRNSYLQFILGLRLFYGVNSIYNTVYKKFEKEFNNVH